MRVVIAHGDGVNALEVRQVAHGAGLECSAENCTDFNGFEEQLAQSGVDLVLVVFGDRADVALQAISRAAAITNAPLLAVGPTHDSSLVLRALRAGARQYLDSTDLRDDLDLALDKLAAVGADPRQRGLVISIFAPTPGSGGSTVAANLAGALVRTHPDEVVLVELTREDGDQALLLDLTPRFGVADVCARSQSLDTVGLRHSLEHHRSGLHVLTQGSHQGVSPVVSSESLRRLIVLLRSMFRGTVLELDRVTTDEQWTAMAMSDIVCLVVRPDVPAVRRAQRAVQEANKHGIPRERIRLIVNRWDQSGQLPLKSIQEILGFGEPLLIPDDPDKVNKATNRGLLLTELAARATITRRFGQLAKSLNGRK